MIRFFTIPEQIVLNNFKKINNTIAFKGMSKKIQTISKSRNIIAVYDTDKIFTREDLYLDNLSQFLEIHDLFSTKGSEIDFKNQFLYLRKENSGGKIRLRTANEDEVSYISTEFNFPKTQETIFLKKKYFKMINDRIRISIPKYFKGVRPKPLKDLIIEGKKDKSVDIVICDSDIHEGKCKINGEVVTERMCHTLDTDQKPKHDFKIYLKIEDFKKLIRGDYIIHLTKMSAIILCHTEHPLTYFIACAVNLIDHEPRKTTKIL